MKDRNKSDNPFLLTPIQRTQMRRILGLKGESPETVEALDCVAGWLNHLGVFTDAQVYFAVGELLPFVRVWITEQGRIARLISINDWCWLLITDENWRSFLNLETMEFAESIAIPFLTTVSCNFNELLRRYREYLHQQANPPAETPA
jgi:hypothetical protein